MVSNTPETNDRSNTSSSAAPLTAGTQLQEFVIERLVGIGGFGIVYLAQDTLLHRRVAIKEYMPTATAARFDGVTVSVRSQSHLEEFEMGKRSFINEARMLARFKHPSLLEVFRFWEQHGTAYMAMPFYEGITLKESVRANGPIKSEAQLRSIIDPLLDALDYMHQDSVYHRDIAPDNIMLLSNGRPVLLDLGAARTVATEGGHALTVLVKPGYAPVEQYADDASVRQGPWTDIYALGAVSWFSIMGVAPPPSASRMLRDGMAPLSASGTANYSAECLEGLDISMRIRPEDRPQTITALRSALGWDKAGMQQQQRYGIETVKQVAKDSVPAVANAKASNVLPPTAPVIAKPNATPVTTPTLASTPSAAPVVSTPLIATPLATAAVSPTAGNASVPPVVSSVPAKNVAAPAAPSVQTSVASPASTPLINSGSSAISNKGIEPVVVDSSKNKAIDAKPIVYDDIGKTVVVAKKDPAKPVASVDVKADTGKIDAKTEAAKADFVKATANSSSPKPATSVAEPTAAKTKKSSTPLILMGLAGVAIAGILIAVLSKSSDPKPPEVAKAPNDVVAKLPDAPNTVIPPVSTEVTTPVATTPPVNNPIATPAEDPTKIKPADSVATKPADPVPAVPPVDKLKIDEPKASIPDTPKVEVVKPPEPEPNAPVMVRLNIKPWGEVFVNGKSRVVSPPDKAFSLPPGDYTIEVKNTDNPTASFRAKLGPGEQFRIGHDFTSGKSTSGIIKANTPNGAKGKLPAAKSTSAGAAVATDPYK